MNRRTVNLYFYEGMVIVASILVAFALDAKWASYQDARVEQYILGELLDEFASAKRQIELSVAELESAISASLELAEHFGADTAAVPPDDAVGLVDRILWHRTLEVPTSVLDSIIASGQVRLISNGTLRMALSQWRAFFDDVRENHEWHRVETDEHLVPYVAKHFSIRDLLIKNGEIGLSPDTFAYDFEGMQRDPVFEGRFLWRVRRQQSTLLESNILLAETQKLITLIEAEIDGPQ